MSDSQTYELAVLGMKCNGCASSVKNVLIDIEGVSDADVSVDDGIAKVKVLENSDVTPERLIEAVKDAGYNASLSS